MPAVPALCSATSIMKKKILLTFAAVLAVGFSAIAADTKEKAAKPYPLDKCIVTDEKLGEHGDPYVFTHEGQELKLCCKGCLKDFNKQPAKFVKKLEGSSKPAK
jgi:hypothetical protein